MCAPSSRATEPGHLMRCLRQGANANVRRSLQKRRWLGKLKDETFTIQMSQHDDDDSLSRLTLQDASMFVEHESASFRVNTSVPSFAGQSQPLTHVTLTGPRDVSKL